MAKDLTPQFSRKVLLVSLIFLLANLGIYGLRYIVSQPLSLRPVAPKLVSSQAADIEVKSPYDEDYQPAQEDQIIFSGSLIRTGEAEFAELVLESNKIRLDEQTEIRLLKNNFPENGPFVPEQPRLVVELLAGSIWVDAFDLIEVHSVRSIVRLDHSVGIMTYSDPINRLMVVTGAADLELLSEAGEHLSDFVVPLHNQVTFVDQQVTATYAALRPSKLKKELKMSPISSEVLQNDWVSRNANDFEEDQEAFKDSLITSEMAYRIRSGYQKILSYITFIPEARRNLVVEQAKTTLSYLLGAVQEDGDLEKAEAVIQDFSKLIASRRNDPQVTKLIVETLFDIEYSRCGTPAYLLKESLIDEVLVREGENVFDIYLTDLRRSFYEEDIQASEIIAAKWRDSWKANLTEANLKEFERQTQILNHTILSYIDVVTTPVLNIFDESGSMRMAYAKDLEESRYEVISERLQIASSLVSTYRYGMAKQYLKQSYLSLDIDNLSSQLASTQIFLENGKFLAQRIEYADRVLHGAAEPIDETKFMDYFKTLQRDQQLSADLRKFFELDKEEAVVETTYEAPTAAEVAERFLEARINVNYVDISRQSSSGFYYDILNARLIDRGSEGEILSFDATYDYVSNSVTDVVTNGKPYRGSFTLPDVVKVLKTGGELESRIPTPELKEGIELLITDREKIEAMEGQAIAQDVARQLAFNQLNAAGIKIPDAKFDIVILDKLNLNQFEIKNALVSRPDKVDPAKISFKYHSGTKMATEIKTDAGVALLNQTEIDELADSVVAEIQRVETELSVIGDFVTYTKLNDLYIDAEDITYTPQGTLSFRNLELLPLELKVSGIYDPVSRQFQSVTHSQLSSQNIGVKEYFEALVDQLVSNLLQSNGFAISPGQIQASYPFEVIKVSQLNIGGYTFDFEVNLEEQTAEKVVREGSGAIIPSLTFAELKGLPDLIRLQEASSATE